LATHTPFSLSSFFFLPPPHLLFFPGETDQSDIRHRKIRLADLAFFSPSFLSFFLFYPLLLLVEVLDGWLGVSGMYFFFFSFFPLLSFPSPFLLPGREHFRIKKR